MMATFSPRATSRLMPASTSSSPKRLCRSTIRRRGAMGETRRGGAPTPPPHSPPLPAGPAPTSIIRSRGCASRTLLEATARRRPRRIVLLAIDADARVLGRRHEPGLVAHAVLGHRLDVDAVGPDVLGDDFADGGGQFRL